MRYPDPQIACIPGVIPLSGSGVWSPELDSSWPPLCSTYAANAIRTCVLLRSKGTYIACSMGEVTQYNALRAPGICSAGGSRECHPTKEVTQYWWSGIGHRGRTPSSLIVQQHAARTHVVQLLMESTNRTPSSLPVQHTRAARYSMLRVAYER